MIVRRDIQQQHIFAECRADNARRAENVMDVFSSLGASGTPIGAGTQVRFGWSAFRLVPDGDALRVCEPDFGAWPEQRWNADIDITLDVLALQAGLLHRLHVVGEDAHYDQVVLASPGAQQQPDVFLRRATKSTPEDSGWLLAPLNDPEALSRANELDAIPVGRLAAQRRSLLQVLALPPGYVALFHGDRLERIFDSVGRTVLLEDRQ